jgi:hypothetical protein
VAVLPLVHGSATGTKNMSPRSERGAHSGGAGTKASHSIASRRFACVASRLFTFRPAEAASAMIKSGLGIIIDARSLQAGRFCS